MDGIEIGILPKISIGLVCCLSLSYSLSLSISPRSPPLINHLQPHCCLKEGSRNLHNRSDFSTEVLLSSLSPLISPSSSFFPFFCLYFFPYSDSTVSIDVFWVTQHTWPVPLGDEMVFGHVSSRNSFPAAVSLAGRVQPLCWVQAEKCFPTG